MMWRAKYEKSLAMPNGWQQLPNGRAYCNALNAYFSPWFTKIYGYQILKIGCSRSRILGNVTAKSENSGKSDISHFKRILTANFEKIKRPLN